MGYAAKLGSASSAKLNIVTTTTGYYYSYTAYNINIASIIPNKYTKLSINNFAIKDINQSRSRNSDTTTASEKILNSYNNTTGNLHLGKNYSQIMTADSDYCRFYFFYRVVIFYID